MRYEHFGGTQPEQEQEWEAVLASQGMPNVLSTNDIPSGDALDIGDPREARYRSAEAARVEQSEVVFDSPDTSI